jgi:hypothetical protein
MSTFIAGSHCEARLREKNLTMSVRAEALRHIVSKTITGVVIRNSVEAGPRDQLFIVFTDNTYLEFYGDIGWSSHLEVGDLETVKQYAARLGGNVEVIS